MTLALRVPSFFDAFSVSLGEFKKKSFSNDFPFTFLGRAYSLAQDPLIVSLPDGALSTLTPSVASALSIILHATGCAVG